MLTRFVLCLIMHALGFRSLSLSTSDSNLSIKRVVGVNMVGNIIIVTGVTVDLRLDVFNSGVAGNNVDTSAIISLGANDCEIGIKKEDIIKVRLGIHQLFRLLNRR